MTGVQPMAARRRGRAARKAGDVSPELLAGLAQLLERLRMEPGVKRPEPPEKRGKRR
jgi:hypothetical protein